MKKNILLLFFACFIKLVAGQTHEIDSLRKVLKAEKEDTNKVKTLVFIARCYSEIQKFDTAHLYCNKALDLAKKTNIQFFIGLANQVIGETYLDNGEFQEALPYAIEATKNYEQTGSKNKLRKALSDVGIDYIELGNYPNALQYILREVSISESTGVQSMMANSYIDAANLYVYMRDFDKALDYDSKALKIREALGNKGEVAFVLCNTGTVYAGKEDYEKALDCYLKALAIGEEIKAQRIIIYCTGNIGGIYYKLNQYDKALEYDLKAKKMGEDGDEKDFVALTDDNIGEALTKLNRYTEAENYLHQALAIDSVIGSLGGKKNVYNTLTNLYVQEKQWQNAYLTYRKYTTAKDSLVNQDKSKEIGKLEAKADYDKQLSTQQAKHEEETALAEADSKRQKIVLVFTAAIALAIAIIAVIILRALRVTRKQKEIIQEQKAIVEEKNKDILDSITYAKRLQDAILPPLSIVQKHLPESFIMYKPKDIVAGDFYWLEKVGDHIFIAAADCTGHGVPGAMVSVVCSNALNRTVKEFKITEPGKILDKTRELVLETFEKSEGEIQDGMDISLCSINTNTKQIKWSGAYNPLWYIQKGEMKELAADKQPIGKTREEKPFSTHILELNKGDILYLFTDGYADQFGGEKGKKFKYRQLQEKLIAISHQPLTRQKEILETTLNEWRGSLEQVDDILITGIRI